MSNRVRVVFDLDVEEGSPETVKDAIFEVRREVVDTVNHVTLREPLGDPAIKVKSVGLNSHIHDTGGGCSGCYHLVDRAKTAKLD